jgi:hypothetical protein
MDWYADVSNTDTAEDTLFTYTVLANTFQNPGDKIIGWFAGTFQGDLTDTLQLRLYWGGELILDNLGITGAAGASWSIKVEIMFAGTPPSIRKRPKPRATIYSFRCLTENGWAVTGYGANSPLYSNVSVDPTVDEVFSLTGQSTGADAGPGDIVASVGSLMFQPAAV